MAEILSEISLHTKSRASEKFPDGTYKTGRTYLDFVIDGISLAERFSSAGFDLVGVFSKSWAAGANEAAFKRLLLQEVSDFPNGRCSVFVCGECGDLGCGAVSTHVSASENTIIWKDFGFQNNYEPEIHFEKLGDLGPFHFNIEGYRRRLSEAVTLLKA
ncbi:MAG TPA: hypothetical protein VFI45_00200 [Candidatus Acidoferrum sp.]|nr:hypothetical protein [Candidatus Acidoferrum sp.]